MPCAGSAPNLWQFGGAEFGACSGSSSSIISFTIRSAPSPTASQP